MLAPGDGVTLLLCGVSDKPLSRQDLDKLRALKTSFPPLVWDGKLHTSIKPGRVERPDEDIRGGGVSGGIGRPSGPAGPGETAGAQAMDRGRTILASRGARIRRGSSGGLGPASRPLSCGGQSKERSSCRTEDIADIPPSRKSAPRRALGGKLRGSKTSRANTTRKSRHGSSRWARVRLPAVASHRENRWRPRRRSARRRSVAVNWDKSCARQDALEKRAENSNSVPLNIPARSISSPQKRSHSGKRMKPKPSGPSCSRAESKRPSAIRLLQPSNRPLC